MKKQLKKLVVKTETVRTLHLDDLQQIVGGAANPRCCSRVQSGCQGGPV